MKKKEEKEDVQRKLMKDLTQSRDAQRRMLEESSKKFQANFLIKVMK